MVKDSHQEHRTNSYEDQHSSKSQGRPEEESLETVQLASNDRHNGDL